MITGAQILASLGVGGTKITLTGLEHTYPRGSTIEGSVLVEGGAVTQYIQTLTLRLNEIIPSGKSTETKTHDTIVPASLLKIEPHSSQTYSFILLLPNDASIYPESPLGTRGWQVTAEADIAWALNPRVASPLHVIPHPEVKAVQEAVKLLGFRVTGLYIDFARVLTPDTIVQYYTAPAAYAEQLDGASLHLRVGMDYVEGRFILNWREHSLADRMKALVGGDREELLLLVPRKETLRGKKVPHPPGVLPYLKALLEKAHVYPDSEAQHLVRAASAPEGTTTLLRPASSAPDIPQGTLLRPLEEGQTEKGEPRRKPPIR